MVFTITMPIALANGASILFLISWLLSGDYSKKFQIIKETPFALLSLLLFLLFFIGAFYSEVATGEALSILKKYREFLLIPLILSVFTDKTWQRHAYMAFMLSVTISIVLSYIKWMGWIQIGDPLLNSTFRGHIFHSIYVSLYIYLLAVIYQKKDFLIFQTLKIQKIAIIILMAIAAVNLFYLSIGRTGYVIFFSLLMLFLFYKYKRNIKVLILSGFVVVLMVILTYHFSQIFNERINIALSDITKYQNNDANTSLGMRFIFYQSAIEIIKQKPILGHGTGTFKQAQIKVLKQKNIPDLYIISHPHNEYLMVTIQLGLVGLLLLLVVWYKQWTYRPSGFDQYLLERQGLLLTLVVGCLFNSLIYDSAEGFMYACLTGVFYARTQMDDIV